MPRKSAKMGEIDIKLALLDIRGNHVSVMTTMTNNTCLNW